MKPQEPTAKYYAKLALLTRSFGYCYVHSGNRSSKTINGIDFYVSGYGKSLQGGGHKYKVHAMRDGKPVSTKELKNLLSE